MIGSRTGEQLVIATRQSTTANPPAITAMPAVAGSPRPADCEGGRQRPLNSASAPGQVASTRGGPGPCPRGFVVTGPTPTPGKPTTQTRASCDSPQSSHWQPWLYAGACGGWGGCGTGLCEHHRDPCTCPCRDIRDEGSAHSRRTRNTRYKLWRLPHDPQHRQQWQTTSSDSPLHPHYHGFSAEATKCRFRSVGVDVCVARLMGTGCKTASEALENGLGTLSKFSRRPFSRLELLRWINLVTVTQAKETYRHCHDLQPPEPGRYKRHQNYTHCMQHSEAVIPCCMNSSTALHVSCGSQAARK